MQLRHLFLIGFALVAATVGVSSSAAAAETPKTTHDPLASLARIPWEGGPAYWKQFAATDRANWDDPSFFPIVAWYSGISSDSEVAWDSSHGINTYIGMSDNTDYDLFARNHVFWIGDRLNDTFPADARQWVGNPEQDEVDGRYSNAEGHAYLAALRAQHQAEHSGRFDYNNFTQIVISTFGDQASARQYVNDYQDVVSADMYWYGIPFCDSTPYLGLNYLIPVRRSNCRTASSYGATVRMLRARDASDGKRQPIWNFVENLNGGPGSDAPARYIRPAELEGAAMASIIAEARGLVWFNQSLSGPCQTSGALRTAQLTPHWCGDADIEAMGRVNRTVRRLAPVINTQSYAWKFGPHLTTMLKSYHGSAYVFAMVDGASRPGVRELRLPHGVTGRRVTVLNEHRTIAVRANGTFSDQFPTENTYHVYRVAL